MKPVSIKGRTFYIPMLQIKTDGCIALQGKDYLPVEQPEDKEDECERLYEEASSTP